MGALIALLNLALLFITTLLFDGSGRYFQVSTKNGTAPLVVSVDATYLLKAKRGNTFIWNFGNGESLKTTSPIINYTYLKAGTYSLSLIYQDVIVDKNGKVTIKSSNSGGLVKIVVAPKPNLSPVAKLTCSSPVFLKVDCHAEGSIDSDGSIASYNYNWGDSNELLVTDPSLTSYAYSTSGEKIIRLTVKDNQGAESFVETTVNILDNKKPIASFLCTKNGIVTINCQSTSTDPDQEITNFLWTLDDGTTYSTKSFTHTFNKRDKDVALTSHLVSLEVADDHGLKDLTSNTADVELEPLRSAPRNYVKIFMDQTKIDLRAFISRTQFGIKTAVYKVYDADNVLIHTIPITDFNQNHSTKLNLFNYGNYRVDFKAIDFRDQEVVTQRYFTLTDDTTKLLPFVGFRAIQSNINTVYINVNSSFDYDENLSITSFEIDLGNGEKKILTNDTFLTYTYAAPGVYNITVLAKTNHGTQRSVTQSVTITDEEVSPINPDPTFAYRIYSFAKNVSFYNEKSGTPNGNIISYMWNFGDGSTAFGETQAHFYLPGSYLVSLTVVDSAGLTNTQSQRITVDNTGNDIVANIDCSLSSPYVDITQQCKIYALDKFNEINRIRVVWGDGTTYNLATPFDPRQGIYYPQKKYIEEGTYPVRLIVNTTRGASRAHDATITITERKSVANIQCYVNNLLVFCNGLGSYDPKGMPLKYYFDFGDGYVEENLTGFSSHAYTEAGLYTVKLTVSDQENLTSAKTETPVQTVLPPNQLPVAMLECDSPLPYTIYCRDGGSRDLDGEIVIRKLEFDDNSSEFLNLPYSTRHQFVSAGEHVIKLTVVDNDGAVSTISKTVDVKKNTPPIASFECNTYGPQKMNCYSTSIDSDVGDRVSTFEWEFGDGTTQNGLAGGFDHLYGAEPIYKVKLTVHDQYGGSSTLEKEITMIINQAPIANPNCFAKIANIYQCNSNSRDLDGTIISERWSIDGVTLNGSSILYDLTNGGDFPVVLTLTDDLGKVIVANLMIRIDKPLVDFVCNEISPYKISCNYKKPLVESRNIISLRFQVDKREVYEGENFEHEFLVGGEHKVSLTIFSDDGSSSTLEKRIAIKNVELPPLASFINFADVGLKVIFDSNKSYKQGRKVVSFRWEYGDGTIETTTEDNTTHTFQNVGSYLISLLVTDDRGNTNLYSKSIYVYESEVPDPGEVNLDTLEGVDFDNDGIRDDVQRWINYEAKGNLQTKSILRKLAEKYQYQIINHTNKEISIDSEVQKDKIVTCLLGKVNNDELVAYYQKIFQYLYSSTENRSKAWSLIQGNLAGISSAVPSKDQETRLLSCVGM